MKRVHRLTALGLTAVLGLGMVTMPFAARASEEGERNTALGLTAAAAALLLTQKNKLPGIIAGAGAAYAWKKNQDSINSRHKREREWGYDRNDRRDWDRDDYRYRDNDRNRDDYRYRDNDRDRDDYRYGRRDPVSGRYTNSNSNRYNNNKNNRYRDDDRDDNGGPPFGRALGHNKNRR
jgi:hypothetical protein